ncbi:MULTISPECIES: cellulase family glycosylhydrolase [Klebsiella pneumoniae complex]|uniref:cellulase family glycosylhydrolase n=1 Tax=Klebsiella pneumoniae complex TaxID=3390273 RepID=UPI0007CA31BB|nr:cellulase family glycosylhydrolase [Klebsiella pneumoniae]SAR59983.1 Partial Putative uncharacterized protein precursor [Klebsiella pneumoniae]
MNKLLFFIIFILCSPISQAQKLILGVGIHSQEYDLSSADIIQKIKDLNATSFRDDVLWSDVEEPKGVYSLRKLSKLTKTIELANQNNISVILILAYGNKYYDDGGYPVSQNAQDAFAAYADFVSKKMNGKIAYYEIWNEWTNATGMPKSVPDADVYFNLVKKVSTVIRRNDPHAKILVGGINPSNMVGRFFKKNDSEWISNFYKLGGYRYVDGLSIHSYNILLKDEKLRNPDLFFTYFDTLEESLKKISHSPVPFYITEVGFPVRSITQEFVFYIRKVYCNAQQREYIKGIWWYDLKDDDRKKEIEKHFGLYNKDFMPKEGYSIYDLFSKRSMDNCTLHSY